MKKIATFRKNGKEVRILNAVRIENCPEMAEKVIIIDVTKIEGRADWIGFCIQNCNGYKFKILVAYKDATGKIMGKKNSSNFPVYVPVGQLDGMFPARLTLSACINIITKDSITVEIIS